MAKILAVDDSDSIRMMVEMTLEASGDHELTLAEDGAEGLKAAQADQFDLIITDINMPNMNGFDLIAALRQTTNYAYTPIVCLTTENEPDVMEKGTQLGATGWLTKPFNANRLLKMVQRLV